MAINRIRTFRLFTIQTFCLRWLGTWPGPVQRAVQVKHLALTVLHMVLLSAIAVFELQFAYNNSENLEFLVNCLCLFTTQVLVVLKLGILVWKRQELSELLSTIDGLIFDDPSFTVINQQKAQQDFRCALSILFLTVMTAVFFSTLPVAHFLMSGVNNWELPFFVQLPYNYQYFPVYQLTYLAGSYSLWTLTFSVTGMDSLMMGCCFYLSGQFDIVDRQISDLNTVAGGDQEIRRKLIVIIDHHNRTLDLCERMVEIFGTIILTQFISASLVAAMTSFNMIYAVGWDRVKYFCYFGVTVAQMFFFCSNGTILSDSSAKIASTAYDFQWHVYGKNVQVLIQMIMIRSQKESQVKVPFVVASMETFATFVKSIGTFMTFLKSFL